jgi:hypothetical protein
MNFKNKESSAEENKFRDLEVAVSEKEGTRNCSGVERWLSSNIKLEKFKLWVLEGGLNFQEK